MPRIAQEFADIPGSVHPPWLYCTFRPVYRAMGGRMAQGSIHARQRVEQFGDGLGVAVGAVAPLGHLEGTRAGETHRPLRREFRCREAPSPDAREEPE